MAMRELKGNMLVYFPYLSEIFANIKRICFICGFGAINVVLSRKKGTSFRLTTVSLLDAIGSRKIPFYANGKQQKSR